MCADADALDHGLPGDEQVLRALGGRTPRNRPSSACAGPAEVGLIRLTPQPLSEDAIHRKRRYKVVVAGWSAGDVAGNGSDSGLRVDGPCVVNRESDVRWYRDLRKRQRHRTPQVDLAGHHDVVSSSGGGHEFDVALEGVIRIRTRHLSEIPRTPGICRYVTYESRVANPHVGAYARVDRGREPIPNGRSSTIWVIRRSGGSRRVDRVCERQRRNNRGVLHVVVRRRAEHGEVERSRWTGPVQGRNHDVVCAVGRRVEHDLRGQAVSAAS